MASGNIWNLSPPQPLLPASGQPILKWEEWREYFENYISTFEEDFTAEKKKKILLHCLGAGGLNNYK